MSVATAGREVIQAMPCLVTWMKRVLKHAFRTLKLHRLEANIQPANAASIALVGACGFRKEGLSPKYLKVYGRSRDHERWAVLAR
jgi:ribosomal-protein-alanine N-acetyltransferase